MQISALYEKNKNESRVALAPDSVKLYQKIGFEVIVEKGAGIN